MGRYKSAATQRRDRDTRSAAIKLGFVGLVLVGLVVVYFQTVGSRRTLDELTLCPADADSITILLVDVTDPMNLPQRQDFINQLERLRSSIPRYGKLAIYKVDAQSEKLLSPVIERCNPGTAADASEWTGNPASLAKRWEDGFKAPLDRAFSDIANASGAARSPILESVQSVALTELKTQDADNKPKKLIVASDLLQNTSRISFYERLPDFAEIASAASFRAVRTDLRGVDVELWMLQRDDSAQSQPRALVDLWDQVLTEMGATVQRVYTVSG